MDHSRGSVARRVTPVHGTSRPGRALSIAIGFGNCGALGSYVLGQTLTPLERRETQGTQFSSPSGLACCQSAAASARRERKEPSVSATTVLGRHVRVLQILRHLQSGSGFNVQELAGRLDVCRRTVFRDLSLLRDAGIQLVFDAERECYRLAPSNDLLVMPELDADELTTLVTAVHLSMLQGIPAVATCCARRRINCWRCRRSTSGTA